MRGVERQPASPALSNQRSAKVPEKSEKKKRLDRRPVRSIAWAAGAASFALPWAAFQVIPRPASTTAAQQVIVAPAGSTVRFTKSPTGAVSGVKIVTPKGTTAGGAGSAPPPAATTRASAPPPV
jgi:hypothetical protein